VCKDRRSRALNTPPAPAVGRAATPGFPALAAT
jgi:hypothetical protein